MCECFCGCERKGSPNHDGFCVQCDLGMHPPTTHDNPDPNRDTVEKMAEYFENKYPNEM